METSEAQREASATIRGYVYQFDASIRAILAASSDESVALEGVEDFDITSNEVDTYGQVKYYQAQKLTDATIRDAILPMVEGFLRYPPDERRRKRYILYGYFKQAPSSNSPLQFADLQRILVHRPYRTDDKGDRVRQDINLQAKLGASDQDLLDFCNCLTIHLSEEFDDHRAKVIAELKAALGVSEVEAEGYCYPSAQTAVAALSMAPSKPARTTTRRAFLEMIKPKVALYSAWALREEGENAYCRKIQALHFRHLNIDSRDRFFILTLAASDGIDDTLTLVQHIIARWSSHKIRSKPAKERYAPYLYFPEMSAADLAQLKTRLANDGLMITDGYAFQGAAFSTRHLMLPQTREWPVSARFVADAQQLQEALAAAKLAKLVIQLHTGTAQVLSDAVQQIAVPISGASMARKII